MENKPEEVKTFADDGAKGKQSSTEDDSKNGEEGNQEWSGLIFSRIKKIC